MIMPFSELRSLFSLAPHLELPPPKISPMYDPSSLRFLAGFQKAKSDLLKEVLAEQGWPDQQTEEGHVQAAAFMIVLHADYDPDFQRHCHSLMLHSATLGQTPLGFIAFLTDRILCNEGRHQRFGTQIREVMNGCFVPKPIEDCDQIDTLRALVGLQETLTDYFQRVNSGDLLLYRPLLNGYGEELEQKKLDKILPFPTAPQ